MASLAAQLIRRTRPGCAGPRRILLLAALLAGVGGCASESATDVDAADDPVWPRISALDIRVFDSPTGPMLLLEAKSEGTVAEDQVVPVTLSTTDGAEAEVRMPRSQCGPPSNRRICRQLLVTLYPGHAASELHDFLADLDAPFVSTYTVAAYIGGVVEVLSGSVVSAMTAIQAHSAVWVAEPAGTGDPGEDLPSDASRYLRVTVPSLDNEPAPRSASLRLHVGETVTVRYVQPDGSELTASTLVPAR